MYKKLLDNLKSVWKIINILYRTAFQKKSYLRFKKITVESSLICIN